MGLLRSRRYPCVLTIRIFDTGTTIGTTVMRCLSYLMPCHPTASMHSCFADIHVDTNCSTLQNRSKKSFYERQGYALAMLTVDAGLPRETGRELVDCALRGTSARPIVLSMTQRSPYVEKLGVAILCTRFPTVTVKENKHQKRCRSWCARSSPFFAQGSAKQSSAGYKVGHASQLELTVLWLLTPLIHTDLLLQ